MYNFEIGCYVSPKKEWAARNRPDEVDIFSVFKITFSVKKNELLTVKKIGTITNNWGATEQTLSFEELPSEFYARYFNRAQPIEIIRNRLCKQNLKKAIK